MAGADAEQAWALYQGLADEPAILKDYAKSAKHRWREACFLPVHSSRAAFDGVLQAFLHERGALFEQGLVLRRFHPLVQLGETMRGQPIHEEYRLFCLDGTIIAHAPFRDPARLTWPRPCGRQRPARGWPGASSTRSQRLPYRSSNTATVPYSAGFGSRTKRTPRSCMAW